VPLNPLEMPCGCPVGRPFPKAVSPMPTAGSMAEEPSPTNGAAGHRYRWAYYRSPVKCPVGYPFPRTMSPRAVKPAEGPCVKPSPSVEWGYACICGVEDGDSACGDGDGDNDINDCEGDEGIRIGASDWPDWPLRIPSAGC